MSSEHKDDCCGAGEQRALFGWSPPRLVADTRAKRWLDKTMPATGAPAALYFGCACALVLAGLVLPPRLGLASVGLGSLAGGLWCSGNFWRCRHAHCLVTGGGWLLLCGVSLAGSALGHSLIGGFEPAVFVLVFALSLAFERLWVARSGNNAVCGAKPSADSCPSGDSRD
ncbi:MAG: hypothetical protein ACRC20_06880 [Segniliparus sp.]|uniref:hypothetical protein n=1 Tax=Segniliparus sp. TaxID=2804064 RepID=UPI003F3B267E